MKTTRKWLPAMTAALFIAAGGLFMFPESTAKAPFGHLFPETQVAQATENKEQAAFTEDQAETLLTAFIDKLVQDTDEQYMVKKYQSKQELLNDFGSISKLEVAKTYVDFYYEERDGGLYIVPTELPPWFEKDNPYELKKIDSKKYELYQENTSDLYGSYSITVEFTYENGKWIISNIIHR
ncbi:hypothetical protein [Bacillus marinisedimentorum]|uniref:hypothetical protein n=1 Tax=Bacillus marinisedimentorum TaxID=1821260 RepID=UPI0008721996|nr:hypothetical protein [Bacillus marinisedimentorum]